MDTLGNEVTRLLQDLVRIPSVNPSLAPDGNGESAIAAHLSQWAVDQGLSADIIDDKDGRPSVLLRSGPPHAGFPTLLLCGHLDTVGFGAMADPLEPRIEGDCLYGRGAYDMKAGLAAALIACREVARQGIGVNVVVAAVADEEHGSLGIQRILGRLEADAAIVTEPTEMAIGVAHRGFVWTEIEVKGVAAHGSRPHLGVDAIARTGALLTGLERLNASLATRAHPLLGPSIVHASLIQGGQEASTIPERCLVTIEHRTLPSQSVEDVEDGIRRLLKECSEADGQFVAEARTTMCRPPLETSVDHPLVTALAGAYTGVRSGSPDVVGMSYWADSAFIASRGIPTVLFGPGGEGAHADVEWASITDTIDCTRILIEVARSMEHS
ncbi:M20/M25/M40 family metallo-hydrolase [Arthrobacter sp. Soc17.1.1.1]|uniref:M20/M25/M40 family metallo-hydrolase n=1 Tax=Arthrobacter sp. Soc17.1.1.1 TaxID=3121277 RepID=UPI002FE43BC3